MIVAVPDPDPRGGPAKVDPETLVLRGKPRPAVRFRRGLVIGATAAAAAGVVAVAWLALEPPSLRLAGVESGEGKPLQAGVPPVLADAPGSYGEVPQLGPPLPGDLGRPILAHQRELEGSAPVAYSEADHARSAAEAERQRRAAEQAAVRSSAVIVQRSGQAAPAPTADGGETGLATPASPAPVAENDQALQTVRPASSPWTVMAGTIISASLITGLDSDLPGTVFAQVTENVRDSVTGRTVLIPQGARLIGSYDSVVAYGQRRALVVWQRIVFPDGSSVPLDNMPATDRAGYSGVEDGVDFHTWQLLKGIGLATVLGVGTEIGLGAEESDLVRALRESAQQNTARAGDQIVSRSLDIKPTLTVRPGWPVRAIVHKDLVLRPWEG